MATSLVLTVIGPDRPGLVERLAQTVAMYGANWMESRMAHLAGRFAGVLRVDVGEANAEALTRALHDLESDGLQVVVQSRTDVLPMAPRGGLVLELVGQDRPGIVREISRVLAARGVNVEELHTHTSSAPMSGEMLFHARAHLRLPTDALLDALRETLEEIANELMVDVTLDDF